jgi:hypothetical protein
LATGQERPSEKSSSDHDSLEQVAQSATRLA